jgi:hypothetical protein
MQKSALNLIEKQRNRQALRLHENPPPYHPKLEGTTFKLTRRRQ